MKRFIPLAGLALTFASTTALAQPQLDYYAGGKGDANMMNDTRYEAPRDTQRTYGSSSQQTVARTEPAAGNTSYKYDTKDKDSLEDFTGPYVGGDIGYNIGSYDISNPTGPDGDVGLDGFEGGLFAGYGFSYDMGWLGGYGGLEAGYEWSGADGDLGATSFEKNHAWLITFRPGITMHEDALGYGIIGYSRANFESAGEEEDLDGLVLGAGSEFSTRSPLKARLEYTYTTYEDSDLAGIGFDGHENQIKAGAVLRF